jgi:hypothetical protein
MPPDELTLMAVLLTAPAGNKALALLGCFSGPFSEGEKVLAPLRQFSSPVGHFCSSPLRGLPGSKKGEDLFDVAYSARQQFPVARPADQFFWGQLPHTDR